MIHQEKEIPFKAISRQRQLLMRDQLLGKLQPGKKQVDRAVTSFFPIQVKEPGPRV